LTLDQRFLAESGWKPGDLLELTAVDGQPTIVRIATLRERAMGFARRSFAKYRETFEALAKS
jgi:hypothetical protein